MKALKNKKLIPVLLVVAVGVWDHLPGGGV